MVALTSHVPHLMAALTAARLREGPAGTETLTGQGVRDVTRVAAGDPTLWTDVVRSNAPAVAAVLRDVHDDLTLLLATVEALATPTPAAAPDHRAEAARAVTGLLARGVDGASRIRPPSAGARLRVDLDHGPGGLRRLLHDAAPYGVAPDRTGTALDRDGNLVVHLEVPAAALVAAAAGLATAGWPVTPVGANRA
ncbi:prephenate dehydrogenase dimerization domain-containing protein [Actinoplanes sp. NPDC051343]|uniref:prephenate dehydrogenase dimerization domain-containing protein n=1 Tax=Actinoplanes sp. NPDC051343 TaxID=3363906 RepID=UPI00379AA1F3